MVTSCCPWACSSGAASRDAIAKSHPSPLLIILRLKQLYVIPPFSFFFFFSFSFSFFFSFFLNFNCYWIHSSCSDQLDRDFPFCINVLTYHIWFGAIRGNIIALTGSNIRKMIRGNWRKKTAMDIETEIQLWILIWFSWKKRTNGTKRRGLFFGQIECITCFDHPRPSGRQGTFRWCLPRSPQR